MRNLSIDELKIKINKSVSDVENADIQHLDTKLNQFLNFIKIQPISQKILEQIEKDFAELKDEIPYEFPNSEQKQRLLKRLETSEDQGAFGYFLINHTSNSDRINYDRYLSLADLWYGGDPDQWQRNFNEFFFRPFVDLLKDYISERRSSISYSLTEPANSNDNSITISPIFSTVKNPKYFYDIFVLMPFKEEMKPIYDDHIKNVCKTLNLTFARADDFFSTHSIIEEVWQAIFQSKIIIADCTSKNPNVFYELGIAHCLGKKAILITSNREDIPFDILHLRNILYEYTPRGMQEFEAKLERTIKELID